MDGAALTSAAPEPVAELSTIANDEAVVHTGAHVRRFDGLKPDTDVDLDGIQAHTLPERGELLSTFATANDLHFGEAEAGHIDGVDEWPSISSQPGEPPYSEMMNIDAVAEVSAIDPELVVVKGDLTSSGIRSEYEHFLDVYGSAFGDRLMYIRGNHESYHRLDCVSPSFQERTLPGVTIALIDTSRDGRINGWVSPDQLEWLDELASRTDHPVMVFGHHPIWDSSAEERNNDVFGIVPDDTEQLLEVFGRRRNLAGYCAGHTHRNHLIHIADLPDRRFAEVACVKDYPGSWAEYRVFEGAILQVHRRISTPSALDWSERARHMFGGLYGPYALGSIEERCFVIPVDA